MRCCAAVTCTAARAAGRERRPHTTHNKAPPVPSAGDVQDAAWSCLAGLLIPARAAHPSTCACLDCGPALPCRACAGGSHCQVILHGGGGSTWRSPRDPVQGPYWAVGRNASHLRHGQGHLTSHLTLDRPFGSQVRRRPVGEGSSFQPGSRRRRLVLQRSQPAPGGAGTLFCNSDPLCLRNPFEDTQRPATRESSVRDPALRWVR